MSWSSRFGQWGGRFSPFARNPPSNTQVTDSDFSYITSDDLARHTMQNPAQQASSSAEGKDDKVTLRRNKDRITLPYPTGSFSAGELSVGALRIDAAKALGTQDPRRLKLIYKGKKLEDDTRPVSEVGIHSGSNSEVLVVVGGEDPNLRASEAGDNLEESDVSDDDSSRPDSPAQSGGKKKKKKRSRKSRGGVASPPAATSYSGSSTPRAEYVGTQGGAIPRAPASAPPQARAPPQTDLDKVEAAWSQVEAVPLAGSDQTMRQKCEEWLTSSQPTTEKERQKWQMVGKGLDETLIQIQFKVDVQSEDPKVRVPRKRYNTMLDGYFAALKKKLERPEEFVDLQAEINKALDKKGLL